MPAARMRMFKSPIPRNAVETSVKGSKGFTELKLNGRVVGRRTYNKEGRLIRETSLKDGKKHGLEIEWNDDGTLLSVEPYFEGRIHGMARQYGRRGRVVGTYRLVRGTGYDIWRWEWREDFAPVSEVHSQRDGQPHGYEWWLDPDQRNVHHERHWYEGNPHGIERMWNFQMKLRRGYPKYWIHGEPVTRRRYLGAAKLDKSLPPFLKKDNSPRRRFPPAIQKVLARPTKAQLKRLNTP